jgi:hypothetical protein
MLEARIFLLGARLHLEKLFLLDKCQVTPVYELLINHDLRGPYMAEKNFSSGCLRCPLQWAPRHVAQDSRPQLFCENLEYDAGLDNHASHQ